MRSSNTLFGTTGSISTIGGFCANLNLIATAYNLGTFSLVASPTAPTAPAMIGPCTGADKPGPSPFFMFPTAFSAAILRWIAMKPSSNASGRGGQPEIYTSTGKK